MPPPREIKPMYAFSEKDDVAEFVCVIEGLKVERKLANGFKRTLKNARLVSSEISDQSINIAVQMNKDFRVERFHIKRLPTEIKPEKCKISFDKDKLIIELKKCDSTPWRNYSDCDFETIHLVSR